MKRPAFIAATAIGLGVAAVVPITTPAAAYAASAPAAQVRVATFAVDNMTCPTCPITVKKAMQGVAGVQSVKIDLAAKTATVAFDPKRASPAAIAAASTNAGYPAKPTR